MVPGFKTRLFNSSGLQLLMTNKHHYKTLPYTDCLKIIFCTCRCPAFLEHKYAYFFLCAHLLTQQQSSSGLASWARITILFTWFRIICYCVDLQRLTHVRGIECFNIVLKTISEFRRSLKRIVIIPYNLELTLSTTDYK